MASGFPPVHHACTNPGLSKLQSCYRLHINAHPPHCNCGGRVHREYSAQVTVAGRPPLLLSRPTGDSRVQCPQKKAVPPKPLQSDARNPSVNRSHCLTAALSSDTEVALHFLHCARRRRRRSSACSLSTSSERQDAGDAQRHIGLPPGTSTK